MRKILPLLCILSITISARAQIMQYNSWSAGIYTDSANATHVGLINWDLPTPSFSNKPETISYKTNNKAEKINLSAENIKSFIRGADTFITSKSKLLKHPSFLNILINNQTRLYLLVKIRNTPSPAFGPTLSYHYRTVYDLIEPLKYSNLSIDYFYGTDGENITQLNRKQFIEVMSNIMADKPDTVAKIKNKIFRYGDMYDLIKYYRTGIMPPAPAPDPFSGSNN